ncbi:hypothetical protein ET495_06175 [Xylanimonas allomyrinae]|uniref:Uncharacterized protein n=1 Tax=Xylanimonas allomyrinae TaxID=2509459 RepID=A0A4P6ENJ4_9MICO|nr:hypothetical protein [Xylanimonas allomyrinae]QAY62899.1 hypothetical protein ET495_06175 [Xylanimonas allomyrinae]
MSATTQLNVLHRQADAMTAHGGTVTQRFEAIRMRWESLFVEPDHVANLTAKITGDLDADPGELAAVLAAANNAVLASVQPAHGADVLNAVAAGVLPTQRAEWAKTLPENYARAAKAYNTAAAALVKVIAAVDFDAPPETLLSAPARVREAWGQAPGLAAQVDTAADALSLVAAACDVDPGPEGLGLLARVPESADRRKVFEALDGEQGRLGKWGTLHRLGAELVAPKPSPTFVHTDDRSRSRRATCEPRPVFDPSITTPRRTNPQTRSQPHRAAGSEERAAPTFGVGAAPLTFQAATSSRAPRSRLHPRG